MLLRLFIFWEVPVSDIYVRHIFGHGYDAPILQTNGKTYKNWAIPVSDTYPYPTPVPESEQHSINIWYEIFLTEFIYSKTTSFYIKKYFFLKIRLIRSPNRNNWIKFGFKISVLTLFGSVFENMQKKIRLFRFGDRIVKNTRMPTPRWETITSSNPTLMPLKRFS